MPKLKILITLVFVLSVIYVSAQAQETVVSEISHVSNFELSIIDIYPEKYPEVSVIFQAQDQNGDPIWEMSESELLITENDSPCEILNIKNISRDKPVNIGLVLDCSGSMIENPGITIEDLDTSNFVIYYGYAFYKGFTPALEYAVNGIKEFISNDDGNAQDSVMLCTFSHQVDTIIPLTKDYQGLVNQLDHCFPFGSTAFYDAMDQSIDNFNECDAKNVLIALTDGLDNSSRTNMQSVIEKAKARSIPIYTIGFGGAIEDSLKLISSETGGMSYFTNDPGQLQLIYNKIKEQIRSIYQVDYMSDEDLIYAEGISMNFAFKNDTLKFSNPESLYELPEETIAFIKTKHRNTKISYAAGGFGILVIGIGAFAVSRRKKKKKYLAIVNAYPNPFRDVLNLTIQDDEGSGNIELVITNLQGVERYRAPLTQSQSQISLNPNLGYTGIFLVYLEKNGSRSKAIKIKHM